MKKMPGHSLEELKALSNKASKFLDALTVMLNEPFPAKAAPTFSLANVADLCGISRSQVRHCAVKHNLPLGSKNGDAISTKPRELTLEETILWVQTIAEYPTRAAGELGRILAVCNYKGGVTKTTTAVSLAQALTLKGQKVLVVDCDGQGSASMLLGYHPENRKHVNHEETTIIPFLRGHHKDLRPAIRNTYWHNLDIIPSCSLVLSTDIILPKRSEDEEDFNPWAELGKGIDPLREDYDVIIFDTAPNLGYTTINVMLAADGLIMPSPPEKLDFTSSVQFWGIFGLLTGVLPEEEAKNKRYDFVTILPTKVEQSQGHQLVKSWLQEAYGEFLNAIEIPKSVTANQALTQDKTIFDFGRPPGKEETWRRYKEPVNRFADYILRQLVTGWRGSNV